MKKGLFITILSVFILWGINAQAQSDTFNELSVFTSISIGVPANVYVTQNPHQSVKIETSKENLEKIKVEVRNGNLEIRSKRNNTHFKGNIKIYISMAKINGLALAGSGSINLQGAVTTTNIDLSIAGSGKMIAENLAAENVKISIAGSGKVNLKGPEVANNLKISVAGSGDIHAENFKTKNVKTNISGSGTCYVYADEELTVSMSGSGNVYYTGTPLIDAKISGSGKVKTMQ